MSTVPKLCFVALVSLVVLAASCSSGTKTTAGSRPECEAAPNAGPGEEFDDGPCVLESSSSAGQAWTLTASWGKDPREGTPGDGPCIDMQVSTGRGGGWCDLPEARLIGEWTSDRLNSGTDIAWGPTSAGRVSRVRIQFEGGEPFSVAPKKTPWSEFDYWFATFASSRKPVSLVAFDRGGKEIAREDLSQMPPEPQL